MILRGRQILPLFLLAFNPYTQAKGGVRTAVARPSPRQVRTSDEPPASASPRIPDATGKSGGNSKTTGTAVQSEQVQGNPSLLNPPDQSDMATTRPQR